MTQQQTAAIKAITRANSGKDATRPYLAHGITYDGETVYYTDGYRMAKVNTITAEGMDVIDARDDSNCIQLRGIWNEATNGENTEDVTLPTLDELRASEERTVAIGDAEFNRKYLIDFVKLCKTTAARLKTNYNRQLRKVTGYLLTGASPDGTAESMLLAMIPNWRDRTH